MRLRADNTYYLFSFLLALSLGFTTTSYVPFLLSIGLSLGQVALVNVVFWGTIIVAEIPTGLIADGKGRAWSLKLGAIFVGLGLATYAFAHNGWGALLAEAVEAVGQAFLSGADQAWVTDALAREGRAHEKRRVFATEALLDALAMVLGGLVGALVSLAIPRLVFLLSGVFAALAFLFARTFMNGHGEPHRRVTEIEAFQESIALLRRSRDLQWVVMAGVLFGSVVVFNHYWTPFFEPAVGKVGLSGVWTLMYLALVPTGMLIRRVSIREGSEPHWVAAALVFAGLGLLLTGCSVGLGLALSAVTLHEIGRGMFRPLADAFTQHRVESHYRATFGSLQSFIGKIGFALVPLVVGFSIAGQPNTVETIRGVWLVVGALLASGALLLWLLRPRRN